MKKLFILILMILFVVTSTSGVFAKFPERDIRLIVPFSPGGGNDVGCRILADIINKYYLDDVTMVVENIVGAGGLRGQTYVALAEPDGYVLASLSNSAFTNPYTKDGCPYLVEDFQTLAVYVYDPEFLIVPEKSPFSDFEQFIESAKEDEGVTINTSGSFSLSHITGIMLQDKIPETNFNYVHTGGGGEQAQQLLGEHVDAAIMTAGEAYGHLEVGEVKAIASFSDRRHKVFSDVPTLQEKDIDVVVGAFRGIGAPANISQEIKEFYDDLFNKAINNEEFIERMEELGFPVVYMDSEMFASFSQSYVKDFQDILHLVED